MASITGATTRQLYDMTYRLVNQRARVVTGKRGTFTGKIMSGTWKKADKSLAFSADHTPELISIDFDDITAIQLEN